MASPDFWPPNPLAQGYGGGSPGPRSYKDAPVDPSLAIHNINPAPVEPPPPAPSAPALQPQAGAPPSPDQNPFKPPPGILGRIEGLMTGTPQAAPTAGVLPGKLAQPAQPAATPQQPGPPINNLIYALRHITNPQTAYSRIPLPSGFKGFQGF